MKQATMDAVPLRDAGLEAYPHDLGTGLLQRASVEIGVVPLHAAPAATPSIPVVSATTGRTMSHTKLAARSAGAVTVVTPNGAQRQQYAPFSARTFSAATRVAPRPVWWGDDAAPSSSVEPLTLTMPFAQAPASLETKAPASRRLWSPSAGTTANRQGLEDEQPQQQPQPQQQHHQQEQQQQQLRVHRREHEIQASWQVQSEQKVQRARQGTRASHVHGVAEPTPPWLQPRPEPEISERVLRLSQSPGRQAARCSKCRTRHNVGEATCEARRVFHSTQMFAIPCARCDGVPFVTLGSSAHLDSYM
jgi:hypothetical protein